MCIAKIACNEKGVNGFDIVVFEIIFSLTAALLFIFLFMETQVFYVVKELRPTLLVRCFLGLLAHMSFTVGAALTSITVQLSVGNLAPFVAGTLGYIMIKETMSKFEIFAMFISLGAVILIGIAQGDLSEKDQNDGEEKTYVFFGKDAKTAAIVGFFI